MRLTRFSDYALRLLIYVASRPEQRTTIADAAEAYGISRNHLMKVANRLARAGLLKPSRGRTGGLALGRPAAAISLGEVLRATEPDFALVGCMADESCTAAEFCRLPRAFDVALAAFFEAADRQRLADFLLPPGFDRHLTPT